MSSLEVIDEEAVAPKPWEDCADFEPDLTLEMADGSGSLSEAINVHLDTPIGN